MANNDKEKNQISDEEIAAKLAQIEGNFACVPNAFGNGVGYCAKSFDENGKLITKEEHPEAPSEKEDEK